MVGALRCMALVLDEGAVLLKGLEPLDTEDLAVADELPFIRLKIVRWVRLGFLGYFL